MRSYLSALGIAVALFVAAPAHAQFANRSLGLSAGYMNFNGTASLNSTVFIGFDASLYIESGFEVVSLTKLAFPQDPISGKRVVGLAPSLGIRYLILEESIRPYVGADLSYLHVFKDQGESNFVGIGPNAGVEFFVTDSVSLGARAQFNAYLSLSERVQTSLILSAGTSVYF
ncbi:outer membrane beta-barrel protein [Archangium violaceum]|uniref:outer membrane beta-barrel protein n=1 Tax=Archangium violaceum TaxID=83451 RepID=UPI00194ECE7A|nr:outer membrane beta-barrel protein [Archangium violaceum]QRO00428.1 outer membrane beta-barrel protein [Archangium violaceum]